MQLAQQVINEQLTELANWRDRGGPDPSDVPLGSTA